MSRRLLAVVLAVCALLSVVSTGARAEYPTEPITIIVPGAEGGPTDAVARVIATSIARTLRGAVVRVENVVGAGGTVGAARVARSPSDGHTLLLADNAIATAPSLYRKLPFEPLRDFSAIGLVDEMPLVLVARSGLPLHESASLPLFMRGKSRRLTMADAGHGTPSQLCMLMLASGARGEFGTATYKGSPQAIADVISGQVDLFCDIASQTLPHVRSGKVRAVAVTTGARLAILPAVPTLAELGFEGFDIANWHMLMAPVSTPQPVIDKLVGALQTALDDPAVKGRFATVGSAGVTSRQATPAAARERLARELAKWSPIIHKAGLPVD